MTADRTGRIAYFSMEIALDPAIPTYSGGLGVLAGDLLRSAADLALGLVGVTLVSRSGYMRQRIVDGAQVEEPQPWDPAQYASRVAVKVPVRIAARDVWVAAWQYEIRSECRTGAAVPVLLLDTDLPENAEDDRRLTDVLYGGGPAYRMRQEMVLGIGGARLLEAMGLQVRKYHLNEGHAAFLAVELLARELRQAQQAGGAARDDAAAECVARVRRSCVFTTHTPVPAAMDQFAYEDALPDLGGLVDPALLTSLAGRERLNMTQLALSLSGWVNGVAPRHAQVAQAMFQGYEVHAISNGVHAFSWASDAHRALYGRHIPNWRHEPELLVQATRIPQEEIASAHRAAKAELLAFAGALPAATTLDPAALTVGFARRMTSYKRPHLLFDDLARLRAIASRHPIQVVYAGKAHPRDLEGKLAIERVQRWARELAPAVPVVFLPDYDLRIARLMVAGCDVWLNTPQPPLEASGTSGMKAAVNGVPSLSVLDGWWVEGCAEGVTGWAIDHDPADDGAAARSLLDALEHRIAPMFYGQTSAWNELMRHVVATNGAFFNSHRMLRRYAVEAYSH